MTKTVRENFDDDYNGLDEAEMEKANKKSIKSSDADKQEIDEEELDELSNNTMKSYVKKASSQVSAQHGKGPGGSTSDKTKQRYGNVQKAMSRMKNEEEEIEESEDNLDEAYISRSELMAKMVAYAAKMPKEVLAQSVDTIIHSAEEIAAKNKASTKPDSNAPYNKSTIKSSGAIADTSSFVPIKEDLEAIFGSEELSEDFRLKTETLFEAAVKTKVGMIESELQEQYDAYLEEAKAEYDAALTEATEEIIATTEERVSKYMDYVVEQWMEKNEVALRSNIRAEVAESFMEGLKNLFVEHYIDIPEDKVDVVESLADKVAALEEDVRAHAQKAVEYQTQLKEARHNLIISEMASGLTETQKEKFTSLVEGFVGREDDEVLRTKASYILESISTPVKRSSEEQLNEEIEVVEEKKVVSQHPPMDAYVKALKESVKSKK